MNNLKRIREVAFVLTTAMPAAIVLWVIYHFGENVPFWDDWYFVEDLEKIYSGQYTITELARQHNEHRMVFPRLLMLALTSFSRWNILYQLYSSWILIVFTWFILWDLLRKTLKDNRELIKPLAVLQAFFLFSLSQGENFIWGWQLQWFLANFLVVASIWSLFHWKSRWIGILIGALTAFIATYSIVTGQFLWLLGFIFLLIEREHWKRSQILFWFIAALLSLLGYYFHFQIYESRFLSLYRPIEVLQLIFAITGSPFGVFAYTGTFTISVILGWFGLFSFAIAAVWILNNEKEDRSRWIPWLALACYGFLGVTITSFGRIQFGLEQTAFITRYTIFAILFWSGAIVPLSYFVVSQFRLRNLKINIAIGLCILTYSLGYITTAYFRYNKLNFFQKQFEIGKLALYDAEHAPETDINSLTYNKPEVFRRKTKFLESHRLGPYIQGSSAEILAKINEKWSKQIHVHKLKGVPVPESSISVLPSDVYKTDQSKESVKFKVTGNRGANFSVRLNEIPHWENSKPKRIFLFESKVAKLMRIFYSHSKGKKAVTVYGIPTSEHDRVFRWAAPHNITGLSFRLDYFINPPFEDQLKIICFLSPGGSHASRAGLIPHERPLWSGGTLSHLAE